MNDPSSFFNRSQVKQRSSNSTFSLPEFDRMIELLPGAVLLVEGKNYQILLANSQAVALSGYSRRELTQMGLAALLQVQEPISSLFQQSDAPESTGKEGSSLVLIRRGRETLDIQASTTPISLRQKRYLVHLEPLEELALRHLEQDWQEKMWGHLQYLFGSLEIPQLNGAWDDLLRAGRALTNADALAIYRVVDPSLYADEPGGGPPEPGLIRSSYLGEELPERLSGSDLIHLRSRHVWTSRERTSGTLQRAARARHMTCLATVSMGSENALTGLLALAWRSPSLQGSYLTDRCLPMAQLLADLAGFLLEEHTRRASLLRRLGDSKRMDSIFQVLQGAVQDNVVVLDQEQKVLWLNRAAADTLGYSSNEAAGHPGASLLIGPPELNRALALAQRGVPSPVLQDVRLIRRYGQDFLAQVSILPAMLPANNEAASPTNEGWAESSSSSNTGDSVITAIVVLIQDLSDRERILSQSQQLEQRALLGEVTSVFAHEVRNPINNISTGLQLISYNLPAQDPNQETLSRLQQDCDRLAELMKSVLAFSRPGDYVMEPVDLGALIRRLLDRMRARLASAGVTAHLQVSKNMTQISGNPRALEQIFSNLITNAMQAMSESGGILAIKASTVKSTGGRQLVEVTVADNGPGIPKENLERIFQPFFTTKGSGTGLGLAITKRIVTAHKGNIQVASFPGGTAFTLHFPILAVDESLRSTQDTDTGSSVLPVE